MGLAEKKAIKNLEEGAIPQTHKAITNMIGKDVEISFDWDTFANEESIKDLAGSGLGRVEDGIKLVCRDSLGKEALTESLKGIAFKYVKGADKSLTFKDGILSIAGGWGDSLSDIFTDQEIKRHLEENL